MEFVVSHNYKFENIKINNTNGKGTNRCLYAVLYYGKSDCMVAPATILVVWWLCSLLPAYVDVQYLKRDVQVTTIVGEEKSLNTNQFYKT